MSENCIACGSRQGVLHFGGDGNIPPPGACGLCEPVLASAGRAKLHTKGTAKANAYLAAQAAENVPAPVAAPNGGA
jgi:hypothetical protein